MPYPENLETAMQVEQIIRDHDCEPATIAIMNGQIKIGLTQTELQDFAKNGKSAIKTSRRDLAYVLSQVCPFYWSAIKVWNPRMTVFS